MSLTLDDILGTVEDLPVLLIDSDTVCFRAAAATDGRQYAVGKKVFKYKEDIVKYCVKEGLPVEGIVPEFYPEPLPHALHIVKAAVNGILIHAQKKYGKVRKEFFHTGSENFRKDILPTYKANRIGARKPAHLNACKDYIRSRYGEVSEDGLEADDLIGIRAHQLMKAGTPYEIVSNDKDMKTIPGEYYNWVDETETVSTVTEAMKFFYAQCIAGDTADNIPGVAGLSINNKGTGKAQKIIQTAYEEFREGLASQYCNSFDTEVEFELSVNRLLELHLYEVALNSWLEGGPSSKGSYGCHGLGYIRDEFRKSAQCLFILHHRDRLWTPPCAEWSNYD